MPKYDISPGKKNRSLQEDILFCTLSSRIKQFVVKNCSRERPSSIMTETLKNNFFIAIVTSKGWNFDADFEYINFIKFKFAHQQLRAG